MTVASVQSGPHFSRTGDLLRQSQETFPPFLIAAGSDDQIHAVWADEYFAAMFALRIPTIELHICANGRHPGDPLRDCSQRNCAFSDRIGTPFGTWQFRFIDWLRDLGFLQKPGIETKAAKDIEFFLSQPAHGATP